MNDMTMEHLVGNDLQQSVLERGSLPVREAVDHVLQVCDGLAEAHAQGLVRRDLKPANLFLTRRRTGRRSSRCSTSASPSGSRPTPRI
ncbi:protein kinase domain-containing protein [Sorangium cellulosum]|uniref:protein kinase domain-containing protein n=1 Tax=Sorangium cellulosum TaxID=56 RepID=UPI001A90F788|nr:hypothetical protein [Sorangium cellulosum]